MKKVRLWAALTAHTARELCQRPWLLAELLLLCLFLPMLLAPAARTLLAKGVDFSAVTLAVTAPEGDRVPDLLERYMGGMRDVREFCTFRAMDRREAEEALARGEVTAILVLPEDFVGGVMDGSNPDVTLIVPSDRPLESLLTLWVGQSAGDLLSAVQAGIYAVLDLYDAAPPEGLSRSQVVSDINLRYVNWTVNRQDLFRNRPVAATEVLPVDLHYALSVLAYLGLALAPLFSGVFSAGRLAARRRLRSLGWGSLLPCSADVAACAGVLFLLAAGPALALTKAPAWAALAAAAAFALVCALFGSLCCLVTGSAAACGGLAFAAALVSLAAAGGILPPVMLPRTLRAWSWLSPAAWLRSILALAAGYPPEGGSLWAAAAGTAAAAVLTAALYHRRVMKREAAA